MTGKAKHWDNLTIGSRQRDFEAMCSSFFLQFFPISRVVRLRSEVLSFKQKKKESDPDLAIQHPIFLQHFYMGLDRKTSKLLNMALGRSFLHVSANVGRSTLSKILENIPEEVEEKPLEEESQIVEPEFLPDLSPTSAIPNPEPREKEETPILDFMLEF